MFKANRPDGIDVCERNARDDIADAEGVVGCDPKCKFGSAGFPYCLTDDPETTLDLSR